MAKKKRNSTRGAPGPGKKRGYSAGEWFMASLGIALVLLFLVIILSSIFDF